MTTKQPASDRAARRLSAALCLLGAWTIVVPYLGHAIGLEVDVASRVEIVDHVVPGFLVAVVSGWLFMAARRGRELVSPPRHVAAGVCFLAGFWVFATHVPLIADAVRGTAGWGATVWHASTALPILVASLWYALRA